MTIKPGATVKARHAASLIVLRPNGPAMLMGMRGAGHRFMPNRLVFPGGAVDRADGTAQLARPVPPHVQSMLEKSAKPRLAHALACAAAREFEEETGLHLGHPPDLSGFDYLGRLITPAATPGRSHRGLDHDVEVVGGEHEERVGAAELEDDLLEVPAGELGHRGASALGTSHGDPVHAGIGDHGLDLLVGGVEVDVGAFRGTPASRNRSSSAAEDPGHCGACLSRIVLPTSRLGAAKRPTW